MRKLRVFRRPLGLGAAKIEDVFWESDLLIVRVVPHRGGVRCGLCRRVCPRYDERVGVGAGEPQIWARCGPWWKLRSRA